MSVWEPPPQLTAHVISPRPWTQLGEHNRHSRPKMAKIALVVVVGLQHWFGISLLLANKPIFLSPLRSTGVAATKAGEDDTGDFVVPLILWLAAVRIVVLPVSVVERDSEDPLLLVLLLLLFDLKRNKFGSFKEEDEEEKGSCRIESPHFLLFKLLIMAADTGNMLQETERERKLSWDRDRRVIPAIFFYNFLSLLVLIRLLLILTSHSAQPDTQQTTGVSSFKSVCFIFIYFFIF